MATTYPIKPPEKKKSSTEDNVLCAIFRFFGRKLKKSEDSGVQVGGEFLDRAVDLHEWQERQEKNKQ